MHPLYQRLKELDGDTFEKLCFQILNARFPNMNLRAVDGSGGDGGIDLFVGSIGDSPYVWQCKSFSNGFRSPQKRQVEDSLHHVVSNYSPRKWTLCLSIDPTRTAWGWLDSLKLEWAGRVDVEVWTASEVVAELCYQRSIRNAFFPGAIVDDLPLREVLTKTAGLTDEEARAATEERADQYLTRLQDKDPRFSFEMSMGKNRKPQGPKDPSCLMTIQEGSTAINVYGRDQEALRLDPPAVKLRLHPTGHEKLAEFQRTGKDTLLSSDDLIEINSNLHFLHASTRRPATLLLSRRPARSIPCRVTFGRGQTAVVYDLIELEAIRAGTEEFELRSTTALPFVLVINRENGVNHVQFELTFRGCRPQQLAKFVAALQECRASQHVELVDLSDGKTLFSGGLGGTFPEWLFAGETLIAAAAFIERNYGVTLEWPEAVTDEDLRNIQELKALTDGVVDGCGHGEIVLTKEKHRPDVSIHRLEVLELESTDESRVIFGVSVPLGVVRCRLLRVTPDDPPAFWDRFDKTPVGGEIGGSFSFESSERQKVTESSESVS